ncbi:MAG: hypothetical protein ABRQ26_05585 [Syntrophomonadaceae bacterium]
MKTSSQPGVWNKARFRYLAVILLAIAFCLASVGCKKESSGSNTSTAPRDQNKAAVQETAQNEATGVLSGKWTGKYYYEDGRKSVDFSGTVQQTGDNIAGQFTEPRTDFGPMLDKITFTFTGTMVNNHVLMVKTYSYNTSHKVNYSGTYYPGEKKIKGNWSIENTSGTFEISVQN